MRKTSAGFTLVELIVVIAVIAILAGVAIPVYSGYISSAEEAAVSTQLSAILTAAEAANAGSEKPLILVTVAKDDGQVQVYVRGATPSEFVDVVLQDADFYARFVRYLGGSAAVSPDPADGGHPLAPDIVTPMSRAKVYDDMAGASWTPGGGWDFLYPAP